MERTNDATTDPRSRENCVRLVKLVQCLSESAPSSPRADGRGVGRDDDFQARMAKRPELVTDYLEHKRRRLGLRFPGPIHV